LIQDEVQKECRIIEGHFVSPFSKHLPGIMPPETEIARQVAAVHFYHTMLCRAWLCHSKSSVRPWCSGGTPQS